MPTSASRRATLGLLLTAAGGVLFASKGLFSKALHQDGVDYETLTALRAVLALPLFALLGLWRGFGGTDQPVAPGIRRSPPSPACCVMASAPWWTSAHWS